MLKWSYSPRVAVIYDGRWFQLHVSDDPDWFEASVEILEASSPDDCFAQLDTRRERHEWPFDKE